MKELEKYVNAAEGVFVSDLLGQAMAQAGISPDTYFEWRNNPVTKTTIGLVTGFLVSAIRLLSTSMNKSDAEVLRLASNLNAWSFIYRFVTGREIGQAVVCEEKKGGG